MSVSARWVVGSVAKCVTPGLSGGPSVPKPHGRREQLIAQAGFCGRCKGNRIWPLPPRTEHHTRGLCQPKSLIFSQSSRKRSEASQSLRAGAESCGQSLEAFCFVSPCPIFLKLCEKSKLLGWRWPRRSGHGCAMSRNTSPRPNAITLGPVRRSGSHRRYPGHHRSTKAFSTT
jgi:hypothetical protein